jgi:DNA mismatch repair protein MSH5
VSANSFSSLNIFVSESHPHVHSQGSSNSSGAKEDLSVYGLFHHLARTPQGKYLLRQYFLRPSLDLELLQQRHDTIFVFLKPANDGYMDEIVKSLKSIKNMRSVMVHLRKGMSNGVSRGGGIKSGVWTSLRSFAFHTLGIQSVCKSVLDGQSLPIIETIRDKFDGRALAMLGTIITQTVDFPTSLDTHRTVVNPGVDEALDEIKRTYAGIEDLLGHTSRNVANSIPQRYGLNLNVVFFPQIGFLICMPADPQTGRADWEGGEEDGEQWEKIFSTEDRVYYKDYRMYQLDHDVGDVYAKICGERTRCASSCNFADGVTQTERLRLYTI